MRNVKEYSARGTSLLLGAFVSLTLASGLILAWSPLPFLLRYVVPDDSFYYFVIGRNIAAGLGSTFDRIAPTDGYHPLWMVPVAIIYRLCHDRITAIHVILSVCAGLCAFSIWQFNRVSLLLHVGRGRALLATFLFMLICAARFSAGPLNGLETSLNLVITLTYLSVVVGDLNSGGQRWLTRGVCMGLLFLARTDNVFVVGLAEALLLFERGFGSGIRKSAFSWLVGAVLSAPWLAWCRWKFGSIVQVSGKSTAFLVHQTVAASWTVPNYTVQVLKNVGDLFCYSFAVFTKTSIWFPISLIILGGLLWSAVIRPVLRADEQYAYERPLLLALAVYIVAFLTMHTLRLIYPRPWYYYSLVPLVWLAVARTMCRMRPSRLATFGAIVLAFAAGLVIAQSSRGWRDGPIRPLIARMLASAMPAGSRIGVFNAGTIAYFDDANQVVNLDGLVNNQAYAYIRKKDLCGYILDARINAVGDDIPTLELWSPFFNGAGPACVGAGRMLVQNGAGQYWVLEQVMPIGSARRDGIRMIARRR